MEEIHQLLRRAAKHAEGNAKERKRIASRNGLENYAYQM